ncbi:uncharacterized protein LOC125833339 [Solanum verrucosum]|uniref:uncharacterized protein LOC125833339 n=1 Tax=Solanum verrucosum TaxID=315347 RepID=UPI0020D0C16E|nr:uncharacterized protein LOC125833339 [Solanum verrucosum]
MSLFVSGLSRLSSKEAKATMLVGDMDIARLTIHLQQVEEDKLRDREEFRNKKAKTTRNESGQQKSNVNRSSFQHKPNGPAPLFTSALAPRKKRQGNDNGDNRSQSSLVALPDSDVPRGSTSGIGGGASRLYVIIGRQEQENFLDVVTAPWKGPQVGLPSLGADLSRDVEKIKIE